MVKQKTVIPKGCTLWARKTIFKSDIFKNKPATWFKIWFYLVSRANHTDNGLFRRGQALTSYKEIQKACGVKRHTIDNTIRWLKLTTALTTRKTTRGFFVTIVNYDTYQALDNYKNDTKNDRENGTINKYVNKQECNITTIVTFWDSFRGQSVEKPTPEGNKVKITWHAHRNGKPSEAIISAVKRSSQYSTDEICGAIANYAKVLLGEDSFWTHIWSLPEFLTRGEEKNRDAPRKWWKFLPDNFIEENYLTDKAKQGRASTQAGPNQRDLAKKRIEEERTQKNAV